MTDNHALWTLSALTKANAEIDNPFHAFLDISTMSAELFELPVGGVDTQSPHDLDELYYIIKGRAKFIADGDVSTVQAGDTIFVKAHIEHRFFDIEDKLSILVVFSKKEPSS